MGIKRNLRKMPVIGGIVKRVLARLARVAYPGTRDYWENRYFSGGTAGAGSYGRLAEFKAEVLNAFVKEQNIQSVIEFGCGDGNQLSLADYPKYIGLDVSKTAIRRCIERFKTNETMSFFLYDPDCFMDAAACLKCDLALSLDVVYHLIEDNSVETYFRHLFLSADRFVIVYSSDTETNSPLQSAHVRHRRFTEWVERYHPDWALIQTIKNRYPSTGNKESGSFADFHIYGKKGDDRAFHLPVSVAGGT